MKEAHKSHIISDTEFKILLNRCGAKEVIGFSNSVKANEDKEQIYKTLFDMVKKGYIVNENDGFSVSPNMKLMIEKIISAESILSIVINNENDREYVCYIKGEDVVLVSKSDVKSDSMVFEMMSKHQYENEFCKDITPGYSVELIEKDWEVN